MKFIRYFLAIATIFISRGAIAAHSDYAEAMRIRQLIQQDDTLDPRTYESIVLPVSRGFHQLQTQLCWSYAALNTLETNYLVKHPEAQLELSRRAMQYFTYEDRYTRKINGIENYI